MSKKQENILEYRKQVKRLQQFIRRAEKRGYYFPSDILPKRPKTITEASVRKLKRITPDLLYKKAKYASYETFGEIVSGTKGRKLERKRKAKKAAMTKAAKKQRKRTKSVDFKYIDKYTNKVQAYEHYKPRKNESTDFWDTEVLEAYRRHIGRFQKADHFLMIWLEKLITTRGKHDTAVMLQDAAEAGLIVTYQIAYDSVLLTQYVSAMLTFLPDIGENEMMDIMEAMEEEGLYEGAW